MTRSIRKDAQARINKVVEKGKRHMRADTWVNFLTGLGSSLRDKLEHWKASHPGPLDLGELEALFHNDDMAQTIVARVPEDALREGIEIALNAEDDSEAKDKSKAMTNHWRELDTLRSFKEAATWGRLFGGGAILLGVEGAGPPHTPLREDRITGLRFITVLDRRDLTIDKWYSNPLEKGFGKPELYRLEPTGAFGGDVPRGTTVHESRLILFGGSMTSKRERERNQGWDHSVLQPVMGALRDANSNWKSVTHLFTDLSQAVFKIEGLLEQIEEGNSETMRLRMELVDMCRSVARAIVLDSEGESFERKATPLTGVDKLLELTWLRLAAAARRPVTILMGQAPAGLNATGETDLRWWYDTIRASQMHEFKPRMERLLRILARVHFPETEIGDWEITFPSLWQLAPKEKAEMRKLVAETDKLYVDMGGVLPEEVTLARWGSGAYSAEMSVVDLEARKAMLGAELERARELAENPPTPPPAPPPGAPPQGPPTPPQGGGEGEPPEPGAPAGETPEEAEEGEREDRKG